MRAPCLWSSDLVDAHEGGSGGGTALLLARVLAMVTQRELGEVVVAEPFMGNCDIATAREGARSRGPCAALERGALTEHRTRPDLRDDLPVDLDPEDSVEQQHEVGAGLALMEDGGPRAHPVRPR